MADRSVGMDPPQYIPVSNDSEDCSLEPKACPEPSHACPDARAYPQRRPGSLRRTRFPGGDTGGHLRSGRIEPGRVQLQFPVPGGAVFRHLRSDDRTAGTASRDLDCVGPVQTGTRGGELRQGVHRRLRLRPQLVSAAGGFRGCTPYETLRWRAITPRGRIASSRLSKRLSAVSGGESSRAAPTRLPASLASFWRSTKAPCSSAYWNRPQ